MGTTSDNAANPDPMQAIERLIEILREDLELRAQSVAQLNDLIDKRNELLAGQQGERTEQVRADLRQELDVERQRNKRAKWYTGILGVFAVLVGAVLFYLVYMMAVDMNRMEDYMYNMGHAVGDERVKRRDHKATGTSYMAAMAEDMAQMRQDIRAMNGHMAAMRDDIGVMRIAMIDMDDTMSDMGNDMSAMSNDMHTMSGDMRTMNGTMGRMQFDTLLMRQGVGTMSNDMGAMGVPFRAMNSVAPW